MCQKFSIIYQIHFFTFFLAAASCCSDLLLGCCPGTHCCPGEYNRYTGSKAKPQDIEHTLRVVGMANAS